MAGSSYNMETEDFCKSAAADPGTATTETLIKCTQLPFLGEHPLHTPNCSTPCNKDGYFNNHPRRSPIHHLKSIFAVMVTMKSDYNVAVKFPSSSSSLRTYFRSVLEKNQTVGAPSKLDEEFVMGSKPARDVLARQIFLPSEFFQRKKLEIIGSFDSTNQKLSSSTSSPMVEIPVAGGSLLSATLNSAGLMRWVIKSEEDEETMEGMMEQDSTETSRESIKKKITTAGEQRKEKLSYDYDRWSNERNNTAADILKATRKHIVDTGLLDHLLKRLATVAAGSVEGCQAYEIDDGKVIDEDKGEENRRGSPLITEGGSKVKYSTRSGYGTGQSSSNQNPFIYTQTQFNNPHQNPNQYNQQAGLNPNPSVSVSQLNVSARPFYPVVPHLTFCIQFGKALLSFYNEDIGSVPENGSIHGLYGNDIAVGSTATLPLFDPTFRNDKELVFQLMTYWRNLRKKNQIRYEDHYQSFWEIEYRHALEVGMSQQDYFEYSLSVFKYLDPIVHKCIKQSLGSYETDGKRLINVTKFKTTIQGNNIALPTIHVSPGNDASKDLRELKFYIDYRDFRKLKFIECPDYRRQNNNAVNQGKTSLYNPSSDILYFV